MDMASMIRQAHILHKIGGAWYVPFQIRNILKQEKRSVDDRALGLISALHYHEAECAEALLYEEAPLIRTHALWLAIEKERISVAEVLIEQCKGNGRVDLEIFLKVSQKVYLEKKLQPLVFKITEIRKSWDIETCRRWIHLCKTSLGLK